MWERSPELPAPLSVSPVQEHQVLVYRFEAHVLRIYSFEKGREAFRTAATDFKCPHRSVRKTSLGGPILDRILDRTYDSFSFHMMVLN